MRPASFELSVSESMSISSNSSTASLPPVKREPTVAVLETHRQTIAELLSLQDVLFQSSLLPPDLIARLSVLACRLWREGESLEEATAADAELVLITAEHATAAAAAAVLEEAARIAAMQPAPPPPAPKVEPFRRGSARPAMPPVASATAAASTAPQRPTRGGVVSQSTAPVASSVVKVRAEDEAPLKRLRTAIVVERWKRVQEGMTRTAQQEVHDTEAEALRSHIKLVTAMYQKLWDDVGGDNAKGPRSRPASAARSRPTSAARERPTSAARSRPTSAARERPTSAARSRPGSGGARREIQERPSSGGATRGTQLRPGSGGATREASVPESSGAPAQEAAEAASHLSPPDSPDVHAEANAEAEDAADAAAEEDTAAAAAVAAASEAAAAAAAAAAERRRAIDAAAAAVADDRRRAAGVAAAASTRPPPLPPPPPPPTRPTAKLKAQPPSPPSPQQQPPQPPQPPPNRYPSSAVQPAKPATEGMGERRLPWDPQPWADPRPELAALAEGGEGGKGGRGGGGGGRGGRGGGGGGGAMQGPFEMRQPKMLPLRPSPSPSRPASAGAPTLGRSMAAGVLSSLGEEELVRREADSIAEHGLSLSLAHARQLDFVQATYEQRLQAMTRALEKASVTPAQAADAERSSPRRRTDPPKKQTGLPSVTQQIAWEDARAAIAATARRTRPSPQMPQPTHAAHAPPGGHGGGAWREGSAEGSVGEGGSYCSSQRTSCSGSYTSYTSSTASMTRSARDLMRAERAERAATDSYRARPAPHVRISEAPPPPHGRTCATGGTGFMPHAPASPRVVTR